MRRNWVWDRATATTEPAEVSPPNGRQDRTADAQKGGPRRTDCPDDPPGPPRRFAGRQRGKKTTAKEGTKTGPGEPLTKPGKRTPPATEEAVPGLDGTEFPRFAPKGGGRKRLGKDAAVRAAGKKPKGRGRLSGRAEGLGTTPTLPQEGQGGQKRKHGIL